MRVPETAAVRSPRKWRCSHGHKWEATEQLIGIRFTGLERYGLPDLDLCMRCLYEWYREHLGVVREDL